MFKSKKRVVISLLAVAAFFIYFYGIDPDSKFLQNLSWGAQILLALGIFVIASVGFWMVEIFYDFFIDPIYGKAKDLVDIAKRDSVGAGLALVARSINLLVAALVVMAAILKMS